MKFLLGTIVGVVAAKPALKLADKYIGKNVKYSTANKVAEFIFNLHMRVNDYARDHA